DWDLLRGVQNTDQDRNTIIERLVDDRQLPVYMVGRDGNINVCSVCFAVRSSLSMKTGALDRK
ncbi:hypothetical protein X801_09873, partial [Opisthorchis viverrini]